MAIERTLSIIKPDATKRNLTGKINAKFEEAGLRIVAQKRVHLTKAQAGKFYEVHKDAGSTTSSASSWRRGRSWCRCSRARTPSRRTAK
jgi:nucleoside diphosphate kinase